MPPAMPRTPRPGRRPGLRPGPRSGRDMVGSHPSLGVLVVLAIVTLTPVADAARRPGSGSLAGAMAYEEAGLAGALLCRTLAGLSRDQQALCRRQPDATWTALQGLRVAYNECQQQFKSQRWNCSTLSPRGLAGLAGNPQGAALMRAGFRESAFAHAIAAAGVTHAISRACARGQLLDCGCDHSEVSDNGRLSWVGARALGTSSPTPGASTFPAARWKWSGCSHNVYFGGDFAKAFLDGRRPAADIQARVEQHNSRAGRLAVKNNMQVRCKCHGVSGSCELRTCWRAAPDFRVVGAALKERFQAAVLVDQSNLGSGHPLLRERGGGNRANRRPPSAPSAAEDGDDEGDDDGDAVGGDVNSNRPYRQRPKRRPRPRRRPARDLSLDLLYLQRSPNFCDKDASVGFPGTAGRRCERDPVAARVDPAEGCDSLCCGRGYNLVRANHTRRCQCSFMWCCQVKCETCTVDEWVAVCK